MHHFNGSFLDKPGLAMITLDSQCSIDLLMLILLTGQCETLHTHVVLQAAVMYPACIH